MPDDKNDRRSKLESLDQSNFDEGNAAEYKDVAAATPERYREWVRQVALGIGGLPPKSRERFELECFLSRLRHHTQKSYGDVLFTAMSFLDGQDYEKRPWEDDSEVLFTALNYSNVGQAVFACPFCDISSLLPEVLANGNASAQAMAAKWLPKYLDDTTAVPMLIPLLYDPAAAGRWWAAIHLSRLAPDTPEIVKVLVEMLAGDGRCRSDRLHWDYGLTGIGEAAEALGHLGALARAAIPALLDATRGAARSYRDYDGQLAARALMRIAGAAEALRLLEPLAGEIAWMPKIVNECKQASQGVIVERSPDDPAHACFFARFLWRPGEDDYWRFRTRDARGAY
jgi:hypothetical protein